MGEPLSLDELRERATITVAETAALLGCKPDLLYQENGNLPFMRRVGRRWFVAVPALLAWLGAAEAAGEDADRAADDGLHEESPPLRIVDGKV